MLLASVMDHREVSYTQARASLASLCGEVAEAGTSVGLGEAER